MSIKLVVISGEKVGTEFPITTPTFVIGRGETCHIRPECNFVNRVHCQILVDRDKDTVAIEDCSGAVGTLVNGEKIKWRTFLKHGDRIKVGTLELEIQFAAEEEAEEKQSTRKTWTTAGIASADDGEEKIVQWVNDGQDLPSLVPAAAVLPSVPVSVPTKLVVRTRLLKTIATLINARLVKANGVDLLLLVAISFLLIAFLCILCPLRNRWYFSITSGMTASVSKAWHIFWLACRKVWYQPVWPWWVPVLVCVTCVLVFYILITIRNRLQRRGKM